jgi:hypothetical protein
MRKGGKLVVAVSGLSEAVFALPRFCVFIRDFLMISFSSGPLQLWQTMYFFYEFPGAFCRERMRSRLQLFKFLSINLSARKTYLRF